MPGLLKLEEKNKDKFVLIAPHCQGGTKEEIVAVCKELKIDYTVVNGGEVKGCPVSGIPHLFVFNAKGEMVYNGNAGGEEGPLEAAIKAAPDWLVGDHAYAKLKSQAAQVAARKGLGKVLAECRKLADGPDEASKAEAKWLMERLEPYGKRLLEKAKDAEAEDPTRALDLYHQVATQFDGDDLGKEGADAEKKLKDDPAFKKELDAAKALKGVEAAAEKLKPCHSGAKLDLAGCADCKKKNAAALAGLVSQLNAIVKKYEGTNAAKRAADLLSAWGKS